MQDLPYQLDRTVVIKATPETVFRFFTDSERWADWWGNGSTIDAKVYIRYPNGTEASGEVLDVRVPERIVFTFGFASGKPIAPGSSRITIALDEDAAGTRLRLLHEFAEAGPRDEHVQGWRFQLSLFGNLVANEVFGNAAVMVDAWFEAWAVADAKAREDLFGKIVTPEIQFRDLFSLLDGMEDLTAHAAATQHYMPGIRMHRKGDVRHCQGTVLADWIAVDKDAKELMAGTNVFALDAEGKIESVTGFTNP